MIRSHCIVVIAMAAVLTGSGCASLRTKVAVYKPPADTSGESINSCRRSPREVTEQLIAEVQVQAMFDSAQRPAVRDAMLEAIGQPVIKANEKAFQIAGYPDPYKAAAETWQGKDGLNTIVLRNWLPVHQIAEEVEKVADKLALNLTYALDPVPDVEIDFMTEKLLGSLDSYHAAVEKFAKLTATSLEVEWGVPRDQANLVIAQTRSDLTADVRATGIAASGSVESRLVGYPIFDPNISELSRDNSRWVDFGHNRFRTFGGSAQFVVVREGHVVFRQKSLDFDPTAIVGAGAAIARLGLRLGAALATGRTVPVAADAAPVKEGATPPSEVSVVDIGALEGDRLLLGRRRSSRVEALRALAALLERADAVTTGTVTAADVDILKNDLKSHLAVYRVKSSSQVGGES